jgi:FtsZ-binding cell division protein ZapB
VDNAFDLLEQRVKRAAETLRRLQAENADLRKQLVKAQSTLGQAEKALHAAEAARPSADPEAVLRAEGLARELQVLQRDREELKKRIGRLVEALEGLDE